MRTPEISTFQPTEGDATETARIINEAIVHSAVVAAHCQHGRDRTGLAVGARQLVYGGMNLDDVLAQRKLYGTTWYIDLADHEILECLRAIAQRK